VIDTTLLSVHELRRRIVTSFGPGASGGEVPRMSIRFVSFGFKFGTPVDADLVLDVRFLDNPNFVNELRHLPGTDPAIIAYVLDRDETRQFVESARARRILRWQWDAPGGATDRWWSPITWRKSLLLRPGFPSPSFTAISAVSRPNASPSPTSWAAEAPKGVEARHEADEGS
jgi:hypothetical protein